MLFPQLDKHKDKSSELDEILFKVKEYLNKKLGEIVVTRNAHLSVRFKQFATDFILSKEDALAILELCVDEGILTPEYQFLCPETQNVIGIYYSLKDAPKLIDCEYHVHVTEHQTFYCPIDILFKFSPEILKDLEGSAA